MLRIVLLAVTLLACGNKKKSSGGTASGSATTAGSASVGSSALGSASAIALAAADNPPRPLEPTLTLDANDVPEANVVSGRPLLVTLRFSHPDPTAPKVEPLIIASARAAWTDAVRIEVRDSKNQTQTWPLHALVANAKPTLRLDDKVAGELLWRLSPAEVSAIAPGRYQIVAYLDTTSAIAAGAWKGKLSSAVTAVLGSPPAPADQSATAMLLARDAALAGDASQARAHVDALLAKDPKSIEALTAKGDLAAEAGNIEEALAFYNKAIGAVRKRYPTAQESPRELVRRRNAQLDAWHAKHKTRADLAPK